MNNQLFKNVGTDIKSFAQIAYRVIWGLHIVLGSVFLLLGCFEAADSGKGIFALLGILISGAIIGFGYILSRLSVMLLYAYGEMAERLISIDKKLSETTSRSAPNRQFPPLRRTNRPEQLHGNAKIVSTRTLQVPVGANPAEHLTLACKSSFSSLKQIQRVYCEELLPLPFS